jgi:NADPH-dependent curcumin reductase CurA
MSTVTTATTNASRDVHLVARPDGEPRPDHFELVETHLHPAADGEVLVRNRHITVDPYMRGRMDNAESYIGPFPLAASLGVEN